MCSMFSFVHAPPAFAIKICGLCSQILLYDLVQTIDKKLRMYHFHLSASVGPCKSVLNQTITIICTGLNLQTMAETQ